MPAGQLRVGSGNRRCCLGSWRRGLGWRLSLDTLNETRWQLSRLEIYLLRFQAYLGSSAGSVGIAAPSGRLALPELSLLP